MSSSTVFCVLFSSFSLNSLKLCQGADGLFAYQLAVVIDDHDSGVTDIVRGADLIDNTPRKLAIYQALGWKEPTHMHIPLVLNDRHEKLSKQAGACPLEEDLMMELHQAWKHLRFDDIQAKSFSEFYDKATVFWSIDTAFSKTFHNIFTHPKSIPHPDHSEKYSASLLKQKIYIYSMSYKISFTFHIYRQA